MSEIGGTTSGSSDNFDTFEALVSGKQPRPSSALDATNPFSGGMAVAAAPPLLPDRKPELSSLPTPPIPTPMTTIRTLEAPRSYSSSISAGVAPMVSLNAPIMSSMTGGGMMGVGTMGAQPTPMTTMGFGSGMSGAMQPMMGTTTMGTTTTPMMAPPSSAWSSSTAPMKPNYGSGVNVSGVGGGNIPAPFPSTFGAVPMIPLMNAMQVSSSAVVPGTTIANTANTTHAHAHAHHRSDMIKDFDPFA